MRQAPYFWHSLHGSGEGVQCVAAIKVASRQFSAPPLARLPGRTTRASATTEFRIHAIDPRCEDGWAKSSCKGWPAATALRRLSALTAALRPAVVSHHWLECASAPACCPRPNHTARKLRILIAIHTHHCRHISKVRKGRHTRR